MSKFKEIKKKSKELLEVSSAHGIPNIIRSKNKFIVTMWLAFFVSFLCIGSLLVVRSILDYLKFNTVTTVAIINEPQVPFPAISICGYPSINRSLDETLIKLRFDRLDLNYSSYFDEFQDSVYGKCFRFNSGRNMHNETYSILNSTSAGLPDGLRLDLNLYSQNDYDYGEVLIAIHNQSSPPLDFYNNAYWTISGSWNYYEIGRVFHQQLDEPYSNCLKDINAFNLNKTIVDHIAKLKRKYSQKDCLYLCTNLFALEKSNCNCQSNLDQFNSDCLRKTSKDQMSNTKICITQYLKSFRKDNYEKCQNYCPLECEQNSLFITPYLGVLPETGLIGSMRIGDFGKNNFSDYKQLKKYFVSILIYYKELEYTFISQEAKTETFSFVSNIGGIFGLFLGISFLSFVEILEVLIEIFYILLFKKIQLL